MKLAVLSVGQDLQALLLKAVILPTSGILPIEVNNEEKIISEQSELCSDMVAEGKGFEPLVRYEPDN